MRKPSLAIATAFAAAALAVPALAGAGSQSTVEAAGTDFTPKKVKVGTGDKVVWKAVEGTHTVTFSDGVLDKPLDATHKAVRRKFSQPGTYRYHCRFHGDVGMKGKVVVK
jgi:plastocyanin